MPPRAAIQNSDLIVVTEALERAQPAQEQEQGQGAEDEARAFDAPPVATHTGQRASRRTDSR
jgi:hypothetical protein